MRPPRGGVPALAICCHWVPFHSHVSPRISTPDGPPLPPKSTVRLRTGSCAIAAQMRAGGAVPMTACCHCVPSNSHVSLRVPPVAKPPSTTTRCAVVSTAHVARWRGGGETAGNRCVHVAPFHDQRSFRYAPPNP